MPILKMCENGYYAVNDTAIYVPTDVDFSHDNIVTSDSGRVESGVNRITWVRPDVLTVSLSYERLTGAECEFLKDLLQGKEFILTYYDNGIKTMYGYCGKCTYKLDNISAYANEGGLYKDFKANVVEM